MVVGERKGLAEIREEKKLDQERISALPLVAAEKKLVGGDWTPSAPECKAAGMSEKQRLQYSFE